MSEPLEQRTVICPNCGVMMTVYVQFPDNTPGTNITCEACGSVFGVDR